MSGERILVLDAYGVLYRPGDDVQGLLIPFIAERGGLRSAERIHALYREASLGLITARSFWNGVQVDPALEDEYLARIELVPGIHAFLAQAAERFAAIACLSNDVAGWSRKLRERHRLDGAIGEWVVSGEVGLRKPDPAIYARLLGRLACAGAQAVFVDDRPANLDAARAFGIETFCLGAAAEVAPGHATLQTLADLLASGAPGGPGCR